MKEKVLNNDLSNHKNKTFGQFILFLLFSMVTTVVDIGAFTLSFIISQTFNFFIQRKATFKATNNIIYSGIMYFLMVLIVLFFQIWIPTIVRQPVIALVGIKWGEFLIKNVNMTLSFLIQFPMNKWIIMRDIHSIKPTIW